MLGVLGALPVAASATLATAGSAYADTGSGALGPGGEFDRFVAGLAARDEFSGNVLVTRHGRTVLARSYGWADRARGVRNSPDTRFAMASVTKLFTAVAVARLAQDRKLYYKSTIGEYLDGFAPAVADHVTVHHLLTHTSGLGDYMQAPGFWDVAATWASAGQMLAGPLGFIRAETPAFAPGAGMSYSNSGFHVLGAIVAKAAGSSYYDYVRTAVFERAGMAATEFAAKPEFSTDRRFAHPYPTAADGTRSDDVAGRLYQGTPSGDAYTTCRDLDTFARALLGDRLLEPAFTRLTLNGKVLLPSPPGPPPATSRLRTAMQAYGPVAALVTDEWVVGHGGGSPGESTSLDMYTGSGWVVTVLANYDNAAQAVAMAARDLIKA